jgi:hypothetical protein
MNPVNYQSGTAQNTAPVTATPAASSYLTPADIAAMTQTDAAESYSPEMYTPQAWEAQAGVTSGLTSPANSAGSGSAFLDQTGVENMPAAATAPKSPAGALTMVLIGLKLLSMFKG